MSAPRPEVFISATTADLGSCRQEIKEALLTISCAPVEQRNFPPDARTVREMLRAHIADCHAMIHVAGKVYGAEPRKREPDEPRLSYTQIEHEIARELDKPVFVFVCNSNFPYDPHSPDDDERQKLQEEHRAKLQSGDGLFVRVASQAELVKHVLALQVRFEQISQELSRSRSWLARGVVAGLVLVTALAANAYWAHQRAPSPHTDVEQFQHLLEEQIVHLRPLLIEVVQGVVKSAMQQPDIARTGAEHFELATLHIAQRLGKSPEEVSSHLVKYIEAVAADPTVDLMDKALAAFAQQNFPAAAAAGAEAAREASLRRLIDESFGPSRAPEARVARERERKALAVQVKALYMIVRADGDPDEIDKIIVEAISVAERALTLISQDEAQAEWAELQSLLGNLRGLPRDFSEDWERISNLDRAADAYQAALRVYSRSEYPLDWAVTQSDLASVLLSKAIRLEGPPLPLILEVIEISRDALTELSHVTDPLEWAYVCDTLAVALSVLADSAKDGRSKEVYLTQAVDAQRAAMKGLDPQIDPASWARHQLSLAWSIMDLAQESSGSDRSKLLTEAIDLASKGLNIRDYEYSEHNIRLFESCIEECNRYLELFEYN